MGKKKKTKKTKKTSQGKKAPTKTEEKQIVKKEASTKGKNTKVEASKKEKNTKVEASKKEKSTKVEASKKEKSTKKETGKKEKSTKKEDKNKLVRKFTMELPTQTAVNEPEFITYDINYASFESDYPPETQKEIEELYYQIQIVGRARTAIPRLLELIKKNPSLPVFYNYISVAYNKVEDWENAEYWIKKNCEVNPDYIFGLINLVNLHLGRKAYDRVEKILGNSMDLRVLFPHRKVFHISEIRSFYVVLTELYVGQHNIAYASTLYEALEKLDKSHPDVVRLRKLLNRAIHGPLFQRMVKGMQTWRSSRKFVRRYKTCRKMGKELYDKILEAYLDQKNTANAAQELGIIEGHDIVLRGEHETSVLMDFALYEYSKDDKKIIELYRDEIGGENELEEEILEASIASYTSLFEITEVSRIHSTLNLKDMLKSGKEFPIINARMSKHLTKGLFLFTRLIQFKDFNATSGMALVFPENLHNFFLNKYAGAEQSKELLTDSRKRFLTFFQVYREKGMSIDDFQ